MFQGEDEVMFDDYRKELKIIFNNLGQLVRVKFILYTRHLNVLRHRPWKLRTNIIFSTILKKSDCHVIS